MSTSVTSVVSHFPSAQNGFTTTLASTISSGATTVPLNSVAGYTNGQTAVFVVDPSDLTKKQTFTGIIDTAGVQITSVVWTAGTNQTHTGGATVVDYATATHISMITKGLLVQHTQAGAHSAITATSLAATGNLSTSAGTINAATVSSLQDASIPLSTYRADMIFDYVISGGVWTADAAGSTRNASMTTITLMINGQLLNSTNSPGLVAVTARNFTASKDTYVDILNTAGVGTIVYTEVSNNAASPALAANSVRIGIVVTGATTIAAATSINQGNVSTPTLPTIGGRILIGTDSLGNGVYPTIPNLPGAPVNSVIATADTSTSTSYAPVANAGPICAVRIGRSGCALVSVGCQIKNSTAAFSFMGFAISGASTAVANDINAFGVVNSNESIGSTTVLVTGLTPGLNIFTAQYRVSGGNGSFQSRRLTVIPL